MASLHTRGGGSILDYSKLKVPSSDQIFIGGGGGGILDYSSLPSSAKFIFRGRGVLGQPRIGIIDKMNQKFWKPNLLLPRR